MQQCSFEICGFEVVEKLFSAANKSIFRLELLQDYSVGFEQEEFEQFKKGLSSSGKSMSGWIGTIRTALARGVTFQRVRLVHSPLSDYLAYEIECAYRFSKAAGEDIRVIQDNTWPLFRTEVPLLMDFWLFDDSVAFLMHYDLLGRYIGASSVPSAEVPYYVQLKSEAIPRSVDIYESGLLTRDLL